MALRSSWEGHLRFNLISVPVKAFTAAAPARGKVAFNQIHSVCHSRIRHQKVCPVHGEVPNDEIVPGHEVAKDQYVLLDPAELKALRSDDDRSIDIDCFIRPGALDPIYLTDRTYYLAPDGKAGEKPYAVLHDVMKETDRQAIAKMVVAGREQPALVRALDKILAVTALSYAAQVKAPDQVEEEVSAAKVSAAEAKLARTLIETATVKKLDFEKYEDTYTDEVTKMIEAKAAGKKIVAPKESHEPAIINLMDALKQSLNAAKSGRSPSRVRKKSAARALRHGKAHRPAAHRQVRRHTA